MNPNRLTNVIKFLVQFSISGLAIAFILIVSFPDKFLPHPEMQVNNISLEEKNPVEILLL